MPARDPPSTRTLYMCSDLHTSTTYTEESSFQVWYDAYSPPTFGGGADDTRERRRGRTFRPDPFAYYGCYLRIFVTLPAPTVRPPSRMAKPRPSSMAMGWISSTVMSVVSPGMTISVPSGSVMTPVTSVVRK